MATYVALFEAQGFNAKADQVNAALAPATSSDRRGFIRPSILPRPTENDPAEWPQTCRCHSWLCQSAASALPRGAAAWDTLEVPTYRHEKYPAYQSGREFDDALIEQLYVLPEFVAACGFQNAKASGFEADDFLAAAAAAEEKRGGTVLIASGDRDTFQLASDSTTILYPVRGGDMARVDPAAVRARYDVDPVQVPDFIALRGDPSDKLPGAKGVGAIGAATLLQRYGTLEAALAAGRFPAQAEDLRLFRSIATMNPNAPLPSLRSQKPTWNKAAALARNWELNQLAKRLEEFAAV